MITLAQAAARVNMNPRALRRALHRDRVAVYSFTRRACSLRLEEFEAWIERKRTDGSEAPGLGTLKRVRPDARRRPA